MASSFTGFCDALIDDLQANVPAFAHAIVHRYATYDPERFVAESRERHFAVWPSDELEVAVPLVTGPGGSVLNQSYQIAYWEDAGDEPTRALADEPAAADLLALLELTRARLYAVENTFLGGAEHIRYLGAAWSSRSGHVRWFQVGVEVRTSAVVT